ncbi:MAG: lactate racemase domain-containing protein [Gemmataceae bacterium]
MPLPLVGRLRHTATLPRVDDVDAAVRLAWRNSATARRIRPGMSIAIAAGSRGIANHATLVKATVEAVKALGANPFIVAAMGSHGGGTADGQRTILSDAGISEATMGVPVRTEMDAEQIGVNTFGRPVWWDRNALAADGVITVGRVKPHTDFRGRYESGIVKMMVVGLGKRVGADAMHALGVAGLRDIMPTSAEVVLAKTRYLGGLATLENAREETARVEVVDRDDVLTREPDLLAEARGLLGRMPFPSLDVLVVGEVGKNFSGSGMDPNVVGRFLVESRPDLETNDPCITRIAALDLSPESHGNGVGVGIADVVTNRLLDTIDDTVTRLNVMTARSLWRAKKPFGFPSDRACIEAAIATTWQPDSNALTFAVIPNSLEVAELWASKAAVEMVASHSDWQHDGTWIELPFTGDTLDQVTLFPHCKRARRQSTAAALHT